jgi:hypothetical protein
VALLTGSDSTSLGSRASIYSTALVREDAMREFVANNVAMEMFIASENIKLFRRGLEGETDPHKREMLEQLLKAEEANLKALNSSERQTFSKPEQIGEA